MVKRYITFAVGGTLRGFYGILEAEICCPPAPEDDIIREFCREHFPRDYAEAYPGEEFAGQVEKYGLRLLFNGAIERYNGKNYWHTDKTLAEISGARIAKLRKEKE